MLARFELTALQAAVLALLAATALGSLGAGLLNALASSGDLQWPAARLLVEGQDPYRAFLDALALPGARPIFPEPSYPPGAYALLAPLGLLDRGAAVVLWSLLNLAAALGSALLLARLAGPRCERFLLLACLLLFLGSTPVRLSLGGGQQGLIAFFLSLAALALGERRPLLAGLLLGAALAKYSVALPFALAFLAQRRLLPLAVAGLLQLALALAVAGWLGIGLPQLLGESLAVAAFVGGRGGGYADVFALAQHLGLDPSVAAGVALLMLAAAGAWLWLRRPEPLSSLALVAAVSLGAAFHLAYESFLLLPLLILFVARRPVWHPLPLATVLVAVALFEWYATRLLQLDAGLAAELALWRERLVAPAWLFALLAIASAAIVGGVEARRAAPPGAGDAGPAS